MNDSYDSYDSYEYLKNINNNENILTKQLTSIYIDQQKRLKAKESKRKRKCC